MHAKMTKILGDHQVWLTVVCVFLGAVYYVKRRRRNKNLPPGPKGLPVVGYIPFVGKNPARTYRELSKKYGPVLSVNIGMQTFVVLNDYDTIHEALVKRGDVFSGRSPFHLLEKITEGLGIVFRNFDDGFKQQRKFALTTLRGFGVGKRSMEDRIMEEIEYFCELIQAKDGRPFNCQTALATSVSNVICSIVMGSRYSYDDEVFKQMVTRLNRAFTSKRDAFCVAILTFAPGFRFFPPFSWVYKDFFDDVDFILKILQDVLDEHKKTFDPENTRDFIDEFLKESHRQGGEASSFKERQLFQVIRDFFLAGTETTSSTLRWCILLLAHFPDIQDKIVEEIKEAVGYGAPCMKHKDDMPYTSAFIHEITRHRTLVPLSVPHSTTADAYFRGYAIPKGTPVLPNLWAVHHDPAFFEKPDEFRPERFISEQGKFVPDKHVIPFSVGPRYCLGEQLAKMELFLFLTSIIQRFQIAPNPEKPLPSFNHGVWGFAEVPQEFEVSFNPRK